MLSEPSKKTEKLSEAEALPVDRLSSLPDSLIFHILSFLPTKQVVAMSVLAKRWKNVWTLVGNIIFDNVRTIKRGFSPIMYRLLLQQKVQWLKRMCLHFSSKGYYGCYGFDENDVNNWISTAIDRSIENLELHFPFEFSPPVRLFNSKTLVKLNMDYSVITNMSVLNAPFLPSLKELRLGNLKFSAEFLKLVILGCPALERLFLSGARDSDMVSCDISSSTLKWLELRCQESHTNMLTQKVVLSVPMLEFIRIHYPSCEIVLEDKLPFLVEADVHLFHAYKRDDSFHDSIPRFIELFSNVRILRLNTDSKRPMIMALQAEFPNLTKLEISSSSFEFTLLESFMEKSINLEIISFEKRHMPRNKHLKVSWKEPQRVPKCLLSSLKQIVIKGYESESELDMVKYFLRNGEILEMMKIHYSENEDNKYNMMIQEILMLRRASRRCQVSFRNMLSRVVHFYISV